MFNRNKKHFLHQVASYNYFVDNLLEILLKHPNPIILSYNWEEELKNYKYELQINILDFSDKPQFMKIMVYKTMTQWCSIKKSNLFFKLQWIRSKYIC